MLKRRESMSERTRMAADAAIRHVLSSHPVLNDTDVILAYMATRGEPDIFPFLREALAAGKRVYLPRVTDRTRMEMLRFTTMEDMAVSAFGIREPRSGTAYRPMPGERVSALIPMVAVDADNVRMGYGRGYYDRYMVDKSAYRIGICYDFQRLRMNFGEAHDIRMNEVITEKNGR